MIWILLLPPTTTIATTKKPSLGRRLEVDLGIRYKLDTRLFLSRLTFLEAISPIERPEILMTWNFLQVSSIQRYLGRPIVRLRAYPFGAPASSLHCAIFSILSRQPASKWWPAWLSGSPIILGSATNYFSFRFSSALGLSSPIGPSILGIFSAA